MYNEFGKGGFLPCRQEEIDFLYLWEIFVPQDGHAAAMYFFTCLGGITVIKAPEITSSTAEERREFIKKKYPCIADCDLCGLCKVFRGRNAENAFEDYISGKRSFMDVSADFKRI